MNSIYVEYQNKPSTSWLTDHNSLDSISQVLAEAQQFGWHVQRIVWEHQNGDCDFTEVWEAAE